MKVDSWLDIGYVSPELNFQFFHFLFCSDLSFIWSLDIIFAGPERIKTVRHPTQKTLAHSLSINVAGCTGRVMPFALVLDDQIEPWVSAERDQVFQVPQWNYHKRDHLVRSSFGLGQMVDFESQEMQSIGNIIYEIHKAVFSIIEEKIMPVLDGQNTLPHRLNINTMDEEYSQYLPESPWVSKLLPKVLKDFPLPKLSSCLVPRQVAAPVAALIEPQDPRVIRSFKVTPVKQPRNQTNGTEEEKSSEGGANKRRRLDLSSQPADNGKATIVGDSKALDGAIKEAAPSVPAVGKTAANAAVDRIPPLADTLQGKKEVEPITPVAILDALEKLHRQYPRDRNSYSIRELPCANSGVKIAIELRGEVEAVGQAESYWEAKRIAASNLYRALNNGT